MVKYYYAFLISILACIEKTYKEIASELSLTPRQVDYLREGLFARFDVHSRIGLAFMPTIPEFLLKKSFDLSYLSPKIPLVF